MSVPQMIAPEPFVSRESHDGRLVRRSFAKMPPVKVLVPAPDEVIASEVAK